MRSKSTTEACATMAHRFELSRSSAIPNIVTDYLLHCGPQHGHFFSSQLWDLILSASFCAAPLSPAPYKGFSPLSTLLLDPEFSTQNSIHPKLPPSGFTSFREVLCFINGCKWLLMTIGHPRFYKLTLAFQGLSYLESSMVSKNLAAKWQDPLIKTAPATYQILELVHNLFATLSATASNLPPSSLIPINLQSPHHNSSYLVSPKIQDATLTIDLAASIHLWKVSCNAVVSELCGSSSSLATLLQSAQLVQISHYLFRASKKRAAPSSDPDPSDKPDKPSKRQKKPQAESNKVVLKSAGNYSVKDLLKLKQEGKIKPPRLPRMRGIQNKNGAGLCFPFLLGCYCDSVDPCGYHLQANDEDHLPGKSKSDWAPFHDWLKSHKEFMTLCDVASSNDKLSP